ncbi:MAG: DUF411 domain-containing protein [Propionivibrio sp.]
MSTFRKIAVMALLAGSLSAWAQTAATIDVYKSPTCGCCAKWIEHVQKAGFKVEVHEVTNIPAARRTVGMPEKYASCHTAKVGGYAIEGHVPAADVQKLLKEKPKAIGIAVPSMPTGAPGMDIPNSPPYQTLLIQADASSSVFVQH